MPAVGPFIFATDQQTVFTGYQNHMYSLYQLLINTQVIPNGYFINAPAAMPSLHTANSFFFLIMAKRSLYYLAVFYAFLFVYIIIFAIGSGWHYVIDLPFGIIISLFALYLVDKVYKEQH
jgi:hypothetical protein